MNTFILSWNPNISSYKMETHLEVVSHAKMGNVPQRFDWSVQDWQKVKDGDMIVLLQVGTDSDGIAMIGKIKGKPEADESWREDGSKDHYVYIEIFDAYNPSEFKELLAENFENEFDKIKWHKGHSGELIDKATADRLLKKLIPIIHRSGHMYAYDIENFIEHGWRILYND